MDALSIEDVRFATAEIILLLLAIGGQSVYRGVSVIVLSVLLIIILTSAFSPEALAL